MITLAIETSTAPTSISLLNNENLIEEVFIEDQRDASSLISKKIEDLISKHLVSAQEIDQIAVGIGPGSYTGLRVGMATAKGLAFALDKPLIPVDSLHAFALQVFETSDVKENVVSMFDARSGKVFVAEYSLDGNVVQPPFRTTINVLEKNNFNDKVACFVPSLEVNINRLKFSSYKNQKVLSYYVGLHSVKYMKNISLEKIAYFEPNYLINNYNT